VAFFQYWEFKGVTREFSLRVFLNSGFLDTLKDAMERPVNAPVGPVPGFNPDVQKHITDVKRSKTNFFM
jgi:hypothetical protein